MAAAVKKCRVCGKNYEACHTVNKTAGVFRWQEVACSPECGAEYLRRIIKSRNPVSPAPKLKTRRGASSLTEETAQTAGPENHSQAGESAEVPVGE